MSRRTTLEINTVINACQLHIDTLTDEAMDRYWNGTDQSRIAEVNHLRKLIVVMQKRDQLTDDQLENIYYDAINKSKLFDLPVESTTLTLDNAAPLESLTYLSAGVTEAQARAAISETITGIDYNNVTGIFSTTTGYAIPTQAQLDIIGTGGDVFAGAQNPNEVAWWNNTTKNIQGAPSLTYAANAYGDRVLYLEQASPSGNIDAAIQIHNTNATSAGGSLMKFTNVDTGLGLSAGFEVGLNSLEQSVFRNYESTNMLFYTNNLSRFVITNAGQLWLAEVPTTDAGFGTSRLLTRDSAGNIDSLLASGGSTSLFLRADGAWATPPDTGSDGSDHNLGDHSDVTLVSPASGEMLRYNGSGWINNTLAELGIEPADSNIAKTDVAENITAAWDFEANIRMYDGVAINFGNTIDAQLYFNSGTQDMFFDMEAVADTDFFIRDGTTNRFMFDSSHGHFHADGNITGYSTSVSDKRLKENIKYLFPEDCLETVLRLNNVEYTHKFKDKDKIHSGYIAQDFERHLPHLITEAEIMSAEDWGYDKREMFKTINYEEVIPYITGAIKALNLKIENLR